jgi:hypothetical protein
MVLKRKFNPDGTVPRWKSRAVLKGCAQRERIDLTMRKHPHQILDGFSESKRLESQTK